MDMNRKIDNKLISQKGYLSKKRGNKGDPAEARNNGDSLQ